MSNPVLEVLVLSMRLRALIRLQKWHDAFGVAAELQLAMDRCG